MTKKEFNEVRSGDRVKLNKTGEMGTVIKYGGEYKVEFDDTSKEFESFTSESSILYTKMAVKNSASIKLMTKKEYNNLTYGDILEDVKTGELFKVLAPVGQANYIKIESPKGRQVNFMDSNLGAYKKLSAKISTSDGLEFLVLDKLNKKLS